MLLLKISFFISFYFGMTLLSFIIFAKFDKEIPVALNVIGSLMWIATLPCLAIVVAFLLLCKLFEKVMDKL